MKILIAEDNPVTRKIHQEQLTTWGYDFDLAVNGEEAVDYARKNVGGYDLCLTDVNMPVMSGIEAIRAIRQGAYYLPIIACSSNPDYKTCCLEAGADAFLVKPFSSAVLKEKLETFSVKQIVLYQEGESLSLHRVGPADSRELNELIMLDKKEVTKFTVVDVSFRFLAHQCARDKLLGDFSRGDSVFTEVLDRTRREPGIVQIHASKIWLRKSSLTPEAFAELVKVEDEMMKKHKEP
ncbi:MAG: response regulator [Gammaproteobacteria bacterium]|nr:response regulator [Gammaproteobacteria bacterium]MCF6259549.1 response regulator [Gammaproteobacteria bacterium]